MILEVLGSAALKTIFGGVTGLFGGWLKNKHDLSVRKLELQEKEADRAHDLQVMEREAEIAKSMTQMKMDENMFKADMASLRESIGSQEQQVSWASVVMEKSGWLVTNLTAFMLGLMTFIQKSVRPGLTIYLIVLVQFLWNDLQSILSKEGVVLTTEQAMSLSERIVDMILYLACTAVAWWFATRPPKKNGQS